MRVLLREEDQLGLMAILVPMLEKTCVEFKGAFECIELARRTEIPFGRRIDFLDIACEEGEGKACLTTAIFRLPRGDGMQVHPIAKNPQKAMQQLEKGCSLGSYSSCAHASLMYRTKYHDVPKDSQKSDYYAGLACPATAKSDVGYDNRHLKKYCEKRGFPVRPVVRWRDAIAVPRRPKT